ncbi:MAG: hypothetical protein AB8B61_07320 [Cyclobacteriaceae bacterium]
MNSNVIKFFPVVALATMATFSSCNAKKQAMKEKAPSGEQEVKVLCSGREFFSDKKNFRANAIGESLDQEVSRKKARNNAKGELAGSVSTTMKAVIDNYVNSREVNNVEEVSEKFEGLTREVIDQELSGIRTICERITTLNGKYKTYLALELGADDLVDAINERLSKEQELKVDYDYEKFKKSFNAEMDKMK